MSRYLDREKYFLELAETSGRFYKDYVGRFKTIGKDTRIMEIGCGEGGNLLPFAQAGCTVFGVDIAENKIRNAEKFFSARGAGGTFLCADFITAPPLPELFDIIIIHDVIEHIEPQFKTSFFTGIRKWLKPDGIVFFGFPAWQMPFGGHQQICASGICSRMPFMHLLPAKIYGACLRMAGEPQFRIDELLSIKRSGMTVERFEKLSRETGFGIADRTLWFISPHYQAKFNLKPRRLLNPVAMIPWLRNFFSTSCFYILTMKG